MGLQSSFKFIGWLNVSNFTRHGIPDRRSSIGKEWCPKCFGLTEYVAFLSQKRSGAVLMEHTHEEDKMNKQGLYQRKRNDKELILIFIWSCDHRDIYFLGAYPIPDREGDTRLICGSHWPMVVRFEKFWWHVKTIITSRCVGALKSHSEGLVFIG